MGVPVDNVSGSASGLLGAAGGPIGLGLSLAPTLFKGISSIMQKIHANKIKPVDPGYQINNEVVDNARILSEKYNNYVMPGTAQLESNLRTSFNTGLNSAEQGATTGGDVIDAATRLELNNNNAQTQLAMAQAQGKEQLLPQVLSAKAMAGNEFVKKNEYDNSRYQEKIAEKGALTQASAINGYSAADNMGKFANSLLAYKTPVFNGDTTGGKNVTIPASLFQQFIQSQQ
jgi:hypothetical protein